MDFKLSDGDWLPDGKGGFVTISGPEECLQRALIGLTVRQGALPFWPAFGSCLSQLAHARPSQYDSEAKRLVYEALKDQPDVLVHDVSVAETNGRVAVTVWLSAENTAARLDVTG